MSNIRTVTVTLPNLHTGLVMVAASYSAPNNSVPAVVSSLPSGDFLVYDPQIRIIQLSGERERESEVTLGIGF